MRTIVSLSNVLIARLFIQKIIFNLPLRFVPSNDSRDDDAGDLGVSDHVLADAAQQEALDGTHAS